MRQWEQEITFYKIKFNVYCVQVFNSFEKEKFCAKYVLNISIERRRGADLKYKIQKKNLL